ncbi:MAG TPA: BlaI/MecI/CopY family transcriptional regulator [Bryobacteraceae bacterium]|nr:BlaI/MecI/CopY family transcriptional regulator [Bryobacteraceae bacterium]
MLVLQQELSRRERQIMDVLYRKGRATAAEIMADMPNSPSNSAVRAILRTLEEKKQIRHEAEDLRYVYMPVVPLEKARRSAVAHVVETFFEGSMGQAVATMLDLSAQRLKPEELDKLAELIEKARQEGR